MWYERLHNKFYYVLGINDSYIIPFERKNPNMQYDMLLQLLHGNNNISIWKENAFMKMPD